MLITKNIQSILYKLQNILVAYSGGLDSSVLLYNLVKLRNKYPNISLRAIHVNHNLTHQSKKWVNICFLECQKLNVIFLHKSIFCNNISNIEEIARIKRYIVFQQVIKNHEFLVTAHHLNDQCETILLALKRGSGPKGLSGIPYQNIINNIKVFRPLLNISKHKILEYAIQNKLQWIDDPSNSNINYDRNFLRNIILPQINDRWSYFNKNIVRSAQLCQEQEKLLNEFLNPILVNLIQKDKSLFYIPLKYYSIYKRNSILRKWLEYNECVMPSRKVLFLIWKDIICCNSPKSEILIKNKIICKYKSYLFCINNDIFTDKTLLWFNIHKPLILPYKLGKLNISLKYTNNSIRIRYPEDNEYIYIKFFNNKKFYIYFNTIYKVSICSIWEKLSIPFWKRKQIPLLFYNNQFIADLENNICTTFNQLKNINSNKILFIKWDNKNN
ncbi:tRNA lysidine(34) synthetase TilS [Enterobacteriaceae endosymbiont of Neohaemonia nigricornis]|uniref:tRNA lysidine(34) synthetase TilS n=1 Tax=Enterobacteriaceae endosymbiont of Neohaemonia nigricornis TaxID=2675792 RepID=UPI0014497C4C|nr:tRNA lysidine(34) synthetase TilS [Enterobacteriaceae endosymbiont of Neohaemonia nigricornis]QJC30415.1 tRNA lysidine(34) synthetase TilS [Enterobacteriaceae endosymbiont of Neohaemonia nigricornis]